MPSCAKPTGQDVGRRLAIVALPLSAILCCFFTILAGSALADDGNGTKGKLVSTSEKASTARLNKLVDELGDELFAVREEATNQLIRAGIDAKPLLLAALSSSDAEVRFRAKRVLEIVVEGDFQRRLKAFAEDVEGSRNLSMPGWKAFKKLAGESRAARAMFVEMQQAEPLLLEAYENDSNAVSQSLAERLQAMQLNVGGRMINQRNRNFLVSGLAAQPSLGSSLALLFVGGEEAVTIKDDVSDRFRNVLNNNELHNTMQVGEERGELSRKIVGRWVRREVSEAAMITNLNLAMRYNLPDALHPAVNVLKRGTAQKTLRYYALITVGNYGNKELLPVVEPLLKDTEMAYTPPAARVAAAPVQPVPGVNNRVVTQTQMRDVALAVTIKLSEQDPKQFGFDLLKLSGQKRFPLESSQSRMGFRRDEDRLAAFKKWEEWQKGQQQAAVEKSKSDTVER